MHVHTNGVVISQSNSIANKKREGLLIFLLSPFPYQRNAIAVRLCNNDQKKTASLSFPSTVTNTTFNFEELFYYLRKVT